MPKRARQGKSASVADGARGNKHNSKGGTSGVLFLFAVAISFALGHMTRSSLSLADLSSPCHFLNSDAWKLQKTSSSSNAILYDNGHINDQSMRMSPFVDHVWLDEATSTATITKKTRLKIVLTDYGWNHPNRTIGMSFPRSLRSRELIQGVLNHPLFDPTFQWSQQQHLQLEEFNGNLQFVVFLDVETCFESNYPLYSKGSLKNLDTDHHRQLYTHPGENKRSCYKFDITGVSKEHPRKGHCPYIDDILRSPFFQSHPNTARLVIFDCQGNGVDTNYRTTTQPSSQLSLVSLSSTAPQLKPEYDLGLPPPAVNPIRLSKSQRDKILSCQGEDDDQVLGVPEGHRFGYYLTCIASVQKRTPTRRTLYDLFHNPANGTILMQPIPFRMQFRQLQFDRVMAESIFSAAPRGDNLFSYRFTEVLSAGAIPVVLADGWVLPFHPLLVDWKECIVIIPESQVGDTMAILKGISPARRCQMRRNCHEIYHKYMAHPEGTIAGIVQVMQRIMDKKQPMGGTYAA